MGYGFEVVLLREKPTDQQLYSWARAALPCLEQPTLLVPMEQRPRSLRVDVMLNVAQLGRATLVWSERATVPEAPDDSPVSFGFLKKLFGDGWAPLPRDSAVSPQFAGRDAFLQALAIRAGRDGQTAGFLADGTASDSGCLLIGGASPLTWSERDCEPKRAQASQLLEQTFGTDLAELTEGPDWKSFWSLPIGRAGRRLDLRLEN